MARKLRKTFSGRQEEVWFTESGGLFGAYDLSDWYQGLPYEIKNRIVEIQHRISSSMMPPWDKESLISGAYEIHRPVLEKWVWQYSDVPPLLSTIFEWSLKLDSEVAQLALDKWLSLAETSLSYGAKFMAYRAAIELYWRRGYFDVENDSEQGPDNHDLQQVEKYGIAVVGLFLGQKLPIDIGPCEPLNRLFLLYKRTGRNEVGLALISKLEQVGYGDLKEIVFYKNSLSKTKKASVKRKT